MRVNQNISTHQSRTNWIVPGFDMMAGAVARLGHRPRFSNVNVLTKNFYIRNVSTGHRERKRVCACVCERERERGTKSERRRLQG